MKNAEFYVAFETVAGRLVWTYRLTEFLTVSEMVDYISSQILEKAILSVPGVTDEGLVSKHVISFRVSATKP